MLPPVFQQWFIDQQWQVRQHQLDMVDNYQQHKDTLLIAPTGAGKTLSGFLPSLVDLTETPRSGLHTLYISPLKALTHDIQRNLADPIEQMGLTISVESRTGDTPSHKRQRQRKKPPNILLTTPESLMLMLSYADAERIFGQLRLVIIDELHSFAFTKRGDFSALALASLRRLAPNHLRFGLSATVAKPIELGQWLAGTSGHAHAIQVPNPTQPDIRFLNIDATIPFAGFMAKYAITSILAAIQSAKTSLIFVNTRAQAELIFQYLWSENKSALPIAIYHGSLSKEQRRKTEHLMASGQLRAIVATSALELGIDWGDLDLVIQVGAPKGVSRLLQRIGRSNHRLDEPSRALLVPANRFEALECLAAINAVSAGELDSDLPSNGALDVIPQFILNSLCESPKSADALYSEITDAFSYRHIERALFDELLQFTCDGGYALNAYDRYARLRRLPDGRYEPASKPVIQRHRQNIGTIVEATRLKVKRLTKAHTGTIIGEVEEYFAQQLAPGDTFLFSGQVLAFVGIKDLVLEARPASKGEPKIPSYVGGQMPMSTNLADGVKNILVNPDAWHHLPDSVSEWLQLQREFSLLPSPDKVLIEQFPHRRSECILFYTFEGRKANQTLGMLVTRRMEKLGLKPLSFSITDYGLSVWSLHAVHEDQVGTLFNPDILGDELEDWMLESPMLKRSFRRVAVVTGLTEQNYHSTQKSMRQVTFSTDLIYDTLRQHDPDHVLLKVTRDDAERELLDLSRLADTLIRFVGRYEFVKLPKASPMSIPIVLDVRSEQISGTGIEAMLDQANLYQEAEQMLEDVRQLLAQPNVVDGDGQKT